MGGHIDKVKSKFDGERVKLRRAFSMDSIPEGNEDDS